MNQGQQILLHPTTPLEHLQRQYLQSMIRNNCSQRTIEYWAMNLIGFNAWCQARGIEGVRQLDPGWVKRYIAYNHSPE